MTASYPTPKAAAEFVIWALGIKYCPFGSLAWSKANATGLIWVAEMVFP